MQPSEVLKKAIKAIDEAEVPEDLREAAFVKAVELIVGESVLPSTHGAVPGTHESSGSAAPAPSGEPANDMYAMIAKYLGIDANRVPELFEEHGGELQWVAELDSFGSTTSAKAGALATILVAARKAANLDDGKTPAAVIRAELDRHGVYDQSNFGKHIKASGSFINVNGKAPNQVFTPKHPAQKFSREAIQRVLGE